ncbi:MAG: type ISP restriction/modification enzyme, partial [Saprospiraceae bacterium]
GLADTSKTKIKVKQQGKIVEQEVHKVQILDPAAGTGTFLAEVIKQIHAGFEGQQGIWSKYVENHLLPRLNGFEILMASYAMAHLKLDLLLTETGYKPTTNQRFKVYLTNSLEEHHPDTGTLFANWLSAEANEANQIKRDTPVMVVMGNPPYSVSSSNKGEWIQNLISDYKKDLNERKINLDDDYIKFIRYGQYLIEKNGTGILAFISANSFIDGVTHRQMRKYLIECFDQIYILNLHGNSKKKEISPDGSPDENVFDIMQGVSINIFVKNIENKKRKYGEVLQSDLFGLREIKYEFLQSHNLNNITWKKLDIEDPYFFFMPKDFGENKNYEKGFKIEKLFVNYNTGIQTKRDALCLQVNKSKLFEIKNDFLTLQNVEIRKKYKLVEDNRDWKIDFAREDLKSNHLKIIKVIHRPFDVKWTFYTGKSKGFIGYPRDVTMKHMISGSNYGLLLGRQNKSGTIDSFFITNLVSEMKCAERTIQSYHFPLYLYSNNPNPHTIAELRDRIANLDQTIVNKISEILDLSFTNEKELNDHTFAPIDILDYIYGVLHSPTYREKYIEFLKIDFPRIPYPKDKDTFWALVKLGGELRQIHLLESPVVSKFITRYPVDGDNIVTKVKYLDGNVYINDQQYFSGVPDVAWNFYIGGYQPAQKWLKDRKDRTLEFEDILHYQKIIVALTETDRIMKEIDKINIE